MSKSKFQTGKVYITRDVNKIINESPIFATLCQISLDKHTSGDWGDLEDEDKESNEDALLNQGRLFSSYNLTDELKSLISVDEKKVWIITEYDRSATTILFPTEY